MRRRLVFYFDRRNRPFPDDLADDTLNGIASRWKRTAPSRSGRRRAIATWLPPERQSLIVDYYRDEKRAKIERRRAQAQRLGITMNALSVRACRIRDALETCVQDWCRES